MTLPACRKCKRTKEVTRIVTPVDDRREQVVVKCAGCGHERAVFERRRRESRR